MDKGDVVRQASMNATKAILKLFPPEATKIVFRVLEDILENGKWKTKVGALDAMKGFVASAGEQVANELGVTLPKVEKAMHDTKSEVRSQLLLGFQDLRLKRLRRCPLHRSNALRFSVPPLPMPISHLIFLRS
jgi:hypothetical protein